MNLKSMLKSKILILFFSLPIIFATVYPTTIHAIKETHLSSTSSFAKEYKFSNLRNLKIETERLVMVPTTDEDLNVLAGYLLENDVSRYLENGAELSFTTKEKAMEYLKDASSD